jgi:hypothetical protein
VSVAIGADSIAYFKRRLWTSNSPHFPICAVLSVTKGIAFAIDSASISPVVVVMHHLLDRLTEASQIGRHAPELQTAVNNYPILG